MEFFRVLYNLAIDMGYYMLIGLLLVAFFNLVIKKEWIAKHLGSDNIWSIVKASIFGVPLPICSCGVIPTGLYLKDKGASTASTTSFLISTPQTGVDSIVATYGLMGITFAWYRPMVAFISGIIGGVLVKFFGVDFQHQLTKSDTTWSVSTYSESHSDDHEYNECSESHDTCCSNETNKDEVDQRSLAEKIKASLRYVFGDFISDIAGHFLIGLFIATLITIFVPAGFLVQIGLSDGILAMLVMIIVGAPMYICSTSSIPIVLSLIAKGLSPGTAFVFLFMGPFTNIASISILGKKLGIRNTMIYLVSAAVCAIGFGYLLDGLIFTFDLPYIGANGAVGMQMHTSIVKQSLGVIFILLIFYHIVKGIITKAKVRAGESSKQTEISITVHVYGMTCESCSNALKTALLNTKGVKAVEVSLEEKSLMVWGNINKKKIEEIVIKNGYTV